MIFVSVGSQLPFDRLIRAMDAWAEQNPDVSVIAQTGEHSYCPLHMAWQESYNPGAFRAHAANATVIVSHAGIGNVLLALELGKPIVLLPRRADLNEHRNDHQLATARQLEGRPGIFVVHEEKELPAAIAQAPVAAAQTTFTPWASEELLGALLKFINN